MLTVIEFHRKMVNGNMYANSQQLLCGIFLFVSLLALMHWGRRGWRNILGVVEECWGDAIILKSRCPSALLLLLLISRTKLDPLHCWRLDMLHKKEQTIHVCMFPVVVEWMWVCQLVSQIIRCPLSGLVPTTVYENSHIRVFIYTGNCV